MILGATLALFFAVFNPHAAHAASGGQNAFVQVESSMIYEDPSFDAPVMSEIKGRTKVRISTQEFQGFYKIKLPNGKIGYIADVDVVTETKRDQQAKQARNERKRQDKQQKQWDKEDKQEQVRPDLAIFESNYIGAFAGIWNYRQKLAGGTQQSALAFYGVKATVPYKNIMLEANWGFHVGAPQFFDKVSVGKPSGFLTDLDFLLVNPIVRASHWMGYLGLGPLFHFRSITTSNGTSSVTSDNFRVGASFSLGGAYQFGRFCTRLEGKYMWQQTGQTAILASLQTSF